MSTIIERYDSTGTKLQKTITVDAAPVNQLRVPNPAPNTAVYQTPSGTERLLMIELNAQSTPITARFNSVLSSMTGVRPMPSAPGGDLTTDTEADAIIVDHLICEDQAL
jgi:hypothetical protein